MENCHLASTAPLSGPRVDGLDVSADDLASISIYSNLDWKATVSLVPNDVRNIPSSVVVHCTSGALSTALRPVAKANSCNPRAVWRGRQWRHMTPANTVLLHPATVHLADQFASQKNACVPWGQSLGTEYSRGDRVWGRC